MTAAEAAIAGLGPVYATWECTAKVGGTRSLRERIDRDELTAADGAILDALAAHTDRPRDLVRRVAESENLFWPPPGA